MSNIQIFNFEKDYQVRTALKSDEPYFCLADVAEILAIQNGKAERFNLDEKGIAKIQITDSLNRKQIATFISEPNLYRVIFRSNKAEAVKFQNWVFDEVLPTIRKTGGYSQKSTPTQRQPLVSACDKLAVSHSLRSEVYKMVGNHFGVDDVASIPTDKIPEAVAFVYELILAKHQNSPQPIPKVNNQALYEVLCDSALRLCDYLRLLKKLSDLPMMDHRVGLNTQKTVTDSYKSIVKLAGELRLTNHQGLPMFTTNAINFYHGGALVFG